MNLPLHKLKLATAIGPASESPEKPERLIRPDLGVHPFSNHDRARLEFAPRDGMDAVSQSSMGAIWPSLRSDPSPWPASRAGRFGSAGRFSND
jgi:hypothetical protein